MEGSGSAGTFWFTLVRKPFWATLKQDDNSDISGDPLRYHSHFVASVVESPTSAIRPMELVAHGRLGTATKKSHLLCSYDKDMKEVLYHSIEWAGFG